MTRVPDTCILVFVQDEEEVARTATFDTLISRGFSPRLLHGGGRCLGQMILPLARSPVRSFIHERERERESHSDSVLNRKWRFLQSRNRGRGSLAGLSGQCLRYSGEY